MRKVQLVYFLLFLLGGSGRWRGRFALGHPFSEGRNSALSYSPCKVLLFECGLTPLEKVKGEYEICLKEDGLLTLFSAIFVTISGASGSDNTV